MLKDFLETIQLIAEILFRGGRGRKLNNEYFLRGNACSEKEGNVVVFKLKNTYETIANTCLWSY